MEVSTSISLTTPEMVLSEVFGKVMAIIDDWLPIRVLIWYLFSSPCIPHSHRLWSDWTRGYHASLIYLSHVPQIGTTHRHLSCENTTLLTLYWHQPEKVLDLVHLDTIGVILHQFIVFVVTSEAWRDFSNYSDSLPYSLILSLNLSS
jgi:hypothetical protein